MITRLLAALLLCLIGFGAHAQPTGCTTTTCTGSALSSGFLSVSGNQFVNGLGQAERLACAEFKGVPNDGTMPAIRAAGFNCIRIDWRDAYTTSGSPPTFTDPFTSLSLHQTWQNGDLWGLGATFDNGLGQGGPESGDFGSQWWVNPFNPNTNAFASCGANCYAGGIYRINPSGTLELGLTTIPAGMQSYINTTSNCNGTCSGAGGQLSYLGGLLNNQNTNTQQFGDYRLTVAVDQLPGFDFQWDIESYTGTTNTNNPPEINFEIYTDASNVMHTILQVMGGSNPVLYSATSPSFNPAVAHAYELNWQANNITFYVDGTQQGQVATNTLPAYYSSGNPMFSYLLSAANYHSGTNPAAASLPVYAHVSSFATYQNPPSGSSGAPNGCNTLAQISTCVSNANAAGLKVVFSHRGNEVPTGACVTQQANGLWFDSGTDSGGSDGCITGTGGYTYAQFKADTVALLQQFASNSTVVAYELHHQPLVNGSFTGTGSSPSPPPTSGSVTMANGQLLRNGSQWVLRGFALWVGTTAVGNGGNGNTGANLQAQFPGSNFINWANQPEGGYSGSQPASNYFAQVNDLLANGYVVMVSDYLGGQPACRSGGDLSNALAWIASWATQYATNPNIMFTTQNECFYSSPAFEEQTFQAYYDAVRGAEAAVSGSVSHVIWMEPGNNQINCNVGNEGIPTGTFNTPFTVNGHSYPGMHNVGWNEHMYPWNMPGGSSNGGADCGSDIAAGNTLSDYQTAVQREVADMQGYATSLDGAMPVITGEMGNATDGSDIDDRFINGNYATVYGATTETGVAGGLAGFNFWTYNYGSNAGADALVLNNLTSITQVGTQIQGQTRLCVGATNCGTASGGGGGGGGGGTTGIPPVSWGGGGPTDVLAAANDVGAAVYAVNPGVVLLVPGPINNGTALLNGGTKP